MGHGRLLLLALCAKICSSLGYDGVVPDDVKCKCIDLVDPKKDAPIPITLKLSAPKGAPPREEYDDRASAHYEDE